MNRLLIFNPDCELAVANGSPYYIPPANIVKMMQDLAFLSAYMGENGDYVLVPESFSTGFAEDHPLGLLCKPVTQEHIPIEYIDIAEPWGWSPSIVHFLTGHGISARWDTVRKEWYSRKTAKEGLIYLINYLSDVERYIIPDICYNLQEIDEKISGGEFMAKAPWSSSGKGLLVLKDKLKAKEKEWLTGIIRKQGYIMLEKRLDKICDFAMEFNLKEDGIVFLGWSVFSAGRKGEYRGNYLDSQEEIKNKLCSYCSPKQLSSLEELIPAMLKKYLSGYRGFLGVDMMIYRNEAGDYYIQPCVEINLRCNMGILALALQREYLGQSSQGFFEIRYYNKRGEALLENNKLLEEMPAVYKNNRIESGYLNLTPVSEATHFIASVICQVKS